MSARGLQFNDKHPARLIPTRPEYYIDAGKIGKGKAQQFIVSIAVTMIGPGLYARNGQVKLRIDANDFEVRRPYFFQPLSYPIHLATIPRNAVTSRRDSLHFQVHPMLQVVDGAPRKLWNAAESLFYYSRDSNLRVFDIKGTFGLTAIPMRLVLLVFLGDREPHCLIFDREKYPEYATKLLNPTWSEHNEGWVPESPELSKLHNHTIISHEGRHVSINVSIAYGVVKSVSSKSLWNVSIRLSELVELLDGGINGQFFKPNGVGVVCKSGGE